MEISLSSVAANPVDCPQPSEAMKGIDDFVVQFWGVRGSVPTPGSETVRYGGNTSCLEMRVGGKRLIFDGGTGLRMLGDQLITFKVSRCSPQLLSAAIGLIFMGRFRRMEIA
jgi:hypothetical protein